MYANISSMLFVTACRDYFLPAVMAKMKLAALKGSLGLLVPINSLQHVWFLFVLLIYQMSRIRAPQAHYRYIILW